MSPSLSPGSPGRGAEGKARARLGDTLHLCLSGERVHILGCEVSEDEFREGFDASVNSRYVWSGRIPCWGLLGSPRAASAEPGMFWRPLRCALSERMWVFLEAQIRKGRAV